MARILVADDNPSIRFLISEIVSYAGYEVIQEANNGLEAVHAYLEKKPDVLIVDYKMPLLDGISVINEIKKNNPKAKIVMCTGSIEDVELECLLSEVTLISKPFNNDDLIQSIKDLLQPNEKNME